MEKDDIEFKAMQEILASLQNLDDEGRDRVLTYVYSRLGITFNRVDTDISFQPQISDKFQSPNTTAYSDTRSLQDIRSLKELKKPSTSVEMAVLVAYYLEELAPDSEKKKEIGTSDITTYFKQAGYALPKIPSMTLVHAKNAGYFESVDRGLFKLNPVGYNLAAYTMGKEGRVAPSPRKSRSKKKIIKKVVKKTIKK